MNNKLYQLNQSYVFAYIKDYAPKSTDDNKGALTIIDNSANNIESLISKYGLYVDDVFIAGGHGFRTLEDLQQVLDIKDNFDEYKDDVQEDIDKLYDKTVSVVLKGVSNESTVNESNENIMASTYNSYGFMTSYKYLKLDGALSDNNIDYTYTLSINTQTDINYIDNIQITANNIDSKDYVEIDNIEATNIRKYKVKFEIHQNSTDNIVEYNDNIKLYIKSLSNQYGPVVLTNSENNTINYEFSKPANKYDDTLEIWTEINSNILWHDKIENLLKWRDKLLSYPQSNSVEIADINNYNFRNTGFNLKQSENPDAYNVFSSLTQYLINGYNCTGFEYNNMFDIVFEGNQHNYDFIVFRNNYQDIEFWFNGIRSNNWVSEKITINSIDYYIWQSPQKYVGRHTWTIKINI